MTKKMRINGMVCLGVLLSAAAFGLQEERGKEPVQIGYLTLDGVEHEIRVGEEARIVISGKEHLLKLRLASFRVFDKAGTTFHYPAPMFFSFDDSDPDVTVWSLDGNNAVIMVQEYREAVKLNDLVKVMAGEYALMKAQVDVSEAALKGPGGLYSGKKLRVQMGEIRLYQELYMVQVGNRSICLILQDSLDEEGKNSEEFEKVRAQVAETFAVRRPTAE